MTHQTEKQATSHGTDEGQIQRLRTVFAGIALAVLGGFFLLIELGVVDLSDDLRDWWPMILIVFGLLGGGVALVAVGSWLLIGSLGLFGLGYSESWPVALIIWGFALTTRALFPGAQRSGCGVEGGRG